MRRKLLFLVGAILVVIVSSACEKKAAKQRPQSGGYPEEFADSTRLDAAPDTLPMDSSAFKSHQGGR